MKQRELDKSPVLIARVKPRALTLTETICTNCLFNEANGEVERSGRYSLSINRKVNPVLLIPCLLSKRGYVSAKKSCKDFSLVTRKRMQIPFELLPKQRDFKRGKDL